MIKNKINHLNQGLQIEEHKLNKLENNTIKSCFGSKKFFKEQFTNYKDNKTEWKENIDLKEPE